MTHVLLISAFWPTQDNQISGIFVVQQIAALCRAGAEVTVLVGRAVGRAGQHYLSPSELGLPASMVELVVFPHLRLPQSLSRARAPLAFNIWAYGKALARRLGRVRASRPTPLFCLVHGLIYPGLSLPHWSQGVAARKLVCIHGVDPFLTDPSVRRFIEPLMKAAAAETDAFLLVGTSLRPHARELGLEEPMLAVIPNGTDLPLSTEAPAASGAVSAGSVTTGSVGAGVHFVSVSNLIALKGIDDNIRALHILKKTSRLSDWHYSVVGEGPERASLEALVASLGLEGHVRFLGRLPYTETMNIIASADIFSLPSWGEAFGIVYLEAMVRGRATIGCLENGAADIITSGVDGYLVPPKNPEALAETFAKLVGDADIRKRLGTRARQTARKFTWDENVRRLMALAHANTDAPLRGGEAIESPLVQHGN